MDDKPAPKKRGRKPSKPSETKQKKTSSNDSDESLKPQTGPQSLPGYTPPPPPGSQPSDPVTPIPTGPPSVTEENQSYGKSKPISRKREKATDLQKSKASRPLPTERPAPTPGALGNKSADCFAYSAEHDSDEEFLRRYAGSPERIRFMLAYHSGDDFTATARERLQLLTKTTK